MDWNEIEPFTLPSKKVLLHYSGWFVVRLVGVETWTLRFNPRLQLALLLANWVVLYWQSHFMLSIDILNLQMNRQVNTDFPFSISSFVSKDHKQCLNIPFSIKLYYTSRARCRSHGFFCKNIWNYSRQNGFLCHLLFKNTIWKTKDKQTIFTHKEYDILKGVF